MIRSRFLVQIFACFSTKTKVKAGMIRAYLNPLYAHLVIMNSAFGNIVMMMRPKHAINKPHVLYRLAKTATLASTLNERMTSLLYKAVQAKKVAADIPRNVFNIHYSKDTSIMFFNVDPNQLFAICENSSRLPVVKK